MSTPATPPPPTRKGLVARLVGATLITLFILGVTLPSLSRGKPDALLLAFIFTPLLLICLGAGRWKLVENVGWALLLILLLMRLAG